MGTEGLRKCCHCGIWFRPHPRNVYHQRYCSMPECQAASKRASQWKWCRKNPGYFHGEAYVKKVQAWRRKHPDYWKAKSTPQACGPPDALQDLLTAQGFDNQDVKVFRNCLSREISRPLQDVLIAQGNALKGLVIMITGEALQEDIARVLITCYERGQRISGIVPWMAHGAPQQVQPQEVKDERTHSDYTGEAQTHSPAVQLDRSSSCP